MDGDTNKAQCIGAEQRGQRGGQKGASDKCQRGSLSRKPRLISPSLRTTRNAPARETDTAV